MDQTISHTLKVSRECKAANTVVSIGSGAGRVQIGGPHFALIAGPCTIESKEMLFDIAAKVKRAGAVILRGGAFKPRTSPYSFQGMGAEGLSWLSEVKHELGIPIVSEITASSQLPLFDDVDMLQVGSRNMQNYELLKALAQTDKPVLLKRGVSATLSDFLLSAEYIVAGGNPNVILCERGIRTFSNETRNTPDIVAIPLLRSMTHLPVIMDPSHATGLSSLVEPIALAATAAGAAGIMTEVHNDPESALCDGKQSITPADFESVAKRIFRLRDAIG